ncbi:hypothetical protein [Streptomyces sp. NPDC026589]|uniref:hypothetical protein n=1 Tax=Streptomyces sp. NPDC026589 TaxID=3155609 RepID=UPI00340AF5DC
MASLDTQDGPHTLIGRRRLMDAGVYVNAVLPPAASPRLRSSGTAVQTDEQMERALAGFALARDVLGPVLTRGA